ncbi:MAG: peptide chain release factor N(5)-glutamine methyltransferase [Candidatus Cloacimonadaceae bacterium]
MSSQKRIKLSAALTQAIGQGKMLGIEEHKIKLLAAGICHLSIPQLAINSDLILSQAQQELLQDGLKRLAKHEPVQYILGSACFYGLDLTVDANVLIPRPETEGLAEWIIESEKDRACVLEIGTGSGAIALALKYLRPDFKIIATDVSLPALQIARANAKNLNLDVKFVPADLFPSLPLRFDLIVSNPPYIAPSDYAKLEEEVRFYEPKLALFAEDKGLEFYRRIIKQAGKYLKPSGKVYLEIGDTQANAISELALKHGFKNVEMKCDLAGRNRYLRFTL